MTTKSSNQHNNTNSPSGGPTPTLLSEIATPASLSGWTNSRLAQVDQLIRTRAEAVDLRDYATISQATDAIEMVKTEARQAGAA